jgi:CheY-like chemotaxis protein
MLAEVLVRILTVAGYQAEWAADGCAAWQRVKGGGFDVVVTDHCMPRMTGLELVTRMRHAEIEGRIVVHSSALNEHLVESYTSLGVDAIVAKPTKSDVLLAAVDPGADRRSPRRSGVESLRLVKSSEP